MNLRTLKKLSKKAAPLLPLLGDDRNQFRAAHHMQCKNYFHTIILERKHWERGRSVHGDPLRHLERKSLAKDGQGWVWRAPPSHPRKGTIMVGSMYGYYEPEWEEETAWEALCSLVRTYFSDWDPEKENVVLTRYFERPGDIIRAAHEMIDAAALERRARQERSGRPDNRAAITEIGPGLRYGDPV